MFDEIKQTHPAVLYASNGTPQAILLQPFKVDETVFLFTTLTGGTATLVAISFFEMNAHPISYIQITTKLMNYWLNDEFPENGLKTALIMH